MSETANCERSSEESLRVDHSSETSIPIAPLPDHIGQNIEAIVALQTSAEQNVPQHQRVVEAATNFFGRPAFLYSSLLVVAVWMTTNLLPQMGLQQFDPPPFDWLQLTLSIIALPMTIAVLIKQDRQEKLAEQRAQLGLQLNLLSEQKIAKLIGLVEELRSDLPNVINRRDPEAEEMKQAADPHVVMDVLEKTLAEELASLQKREVSGSQASD